MPYSLSQIDVIRERMGVGYAEAKRALDEAQGDVITALAALEAEQSAVVERECLEAAIKRFIREVKDPLEGRAVAEVRIKLDSHTLREVPVALGGVKAVLLTMVSALLAHLRLELVPGAEPADREP